MRVTAIVLLRARDGSAIQGHEAISRSTLEAMTPNGEEVDEVERELETLGFTVELRGPLGLAITAEAVHFERVFGVRITANERGTTCTEVDSNEESRVLPVRRLPRRLQRDVSSIEFEGPPDFGPGSFG
ncbi:MAG: hypothetical protein ACOC2Q_01145 [Spirochaetota bacterium]